MTMCESNTGIRELTMDEVAGVSGGADNKADDGLGQLRQVENAVGNALQKVARTR